MKKTILILSIVAFVCGCATVSETYTPDGKQGYVIGCAGAVLSMDTCFNKAGELCRAKGYEVLNRNDVFINRSILIKCKD